MLSHDIYREGLAWKCRQAGCHAQFPAKMFRTSEERENGPVYKQRVMGLHSKGGFLYERLPRRKERVAGSPLERGGRQRFPKITKQRPTQAGIQLLGRTLFFAAAFMQKQESVELFLQNQRSELHGLYNFTVFIHTHIATGDFVDQNYFVVVVTKLEFNVVKVQAFFRQIIGYNAGDL